MLEIVKHKEMVQWPLTFSLLTARVAEAEM